MKTVQILRQYRRMHTFETSFGGKDTAARPKAWSRPQNLCMPDSGDKRSLSELGVKPEITETEDHISIRVELPFKTTTSNEYLLSKGKY